MKTLVRIVPLFALLIARLSAQPTAWESSEGYRSTRLPDAAPSPGGFVLTDSAQTAVAFTNRLAQSRSLTNQIYLNGSGVAAGDVDGDGWCDLYFCGLDNQNELYRNLGHWRFERITETARVGCPDQASTGAALVDFDGDGDLDLAVAAIGRGVRLFLNDGQARFTEVTDAGLRSQAGSMSLAIADVNGDGRLDLYVVNYRASTFRDEPEKRFRVNTRGGKYELIAVDGRPVSEPELAGRFVVDPASGVLEQGEADALYLNEGGGHFRPVDWTGGAFLDEAGRAVTIPYDWGLSAMFRDLNGDQAPDLYVCNDFQSPDRIWLNDGHGRFRPAPAAMFRQTSLFSMGLDFADLDNDGREELFVADMLSRKHERRQVQVMEGMAAVAPNLKRDPQPQISRNTLFWNRGDGAYSEVAQMAGLEASEWSWCPIFIDVDLDGRKDLLVSTGHERDAQHIDVAREIEQAKRRKASWREQLELRRKFPRLESPILAFRNRGELSFVETTSRWGFQQSQITHGMALADFDNDGDLDLAANCLNSPARLYRNEASAPRLAVQLRGDPPNIHGIGAKVRVRFDGLPLQSGEFIAGGRYLSSDAPRLSFAAAPSTAGTIEVTWPDRAVSLIRDAQPNRLYEIFQAQASTNTAPTAPPAAPMFEDLSAGLAHQHHDEPFDDMQRQPLLPRKLSELGPGLAWFDFDGDGWEDLLVGSGRGGKFACFRNNRGVLEAVALPQISAPTRRDQAGLLGWAQGTNRTLLIAFSNYEDAQTNGPSVIWFRHQPEALGAILSGQAASAGALALGDPDADGDLDLFVGGRVIPAQYPAPAHSTFLRNDGQNLIADPEANRAFENLGLVSAALWSDLTGDGTPELLAAIDGGPLRVFTFRAGHFHELTADLGLAGWAGWWQSISTGDFNNDGRMDIVAGNLGRNSPYQRYIHSGFHLYSGQVEDDGRMAIIEAFHDPDLNRIVPLQDRESLALALPGLPQRYPTFTSFSRASVAEILGNRAGKVREQVINTTDSMLFLSGEPAFRSVVLPLPAQISLVFGLAVGDVNADGNEDLFISQNLFSVGRGVSRYDAGQGLLLLGNGAGVLAPIDSAASGIKITGEGRSAAFCDFDRDGRLDLAATQNSGPTKLYRNLHPSKGLRVNARRGPLNPAGIGATVRLRFPDGSRGAAHEIRAGEGYWSQASRSIVLGKAAAASQIEILWPGGKRESFAIPAGAEEITLE